MRRGRHEQMLGLRAQAAGARVAARAQAGSHASWHIAGVGARARLARAAHSQQARAAHARVVKANQPL